MDFYGGVFLASALIGAEAAAEVAVSLPYSRAMEHEADDIGMRIMSRACFDPGAGPRLMHMLETHETHMKQLALDATAAGKEAHTLDDTVFRGLRTHPLNEERVRAMEQGMSAAVVTLENTNCGEYIRLLDRSLASRRLVPNEFPQNHARVLLPSSTWQGGTGTARATP